MDTATPIADFLVYERFDKMGFQLQVEEIWLCFKRCWRSLREPYLRSNSFSFQPLKSIFNIWVTLENTANQDISNKKKQVFYFETLEGFSFLEHLQEFFLNKTSKILRKCTYLSISESDLHPFFSRNFLKALTPVMSECLTTKNTWHPSFREEEMKRGDPIRQK